MVLARSVSLQDRTKVTGIAFDQSREGMPGFLRAFTSEHLRHEECSPRMRIRITHRASP